jgi:hypothetical protein
MKRQTRIESVRVIASAIILVTTQLLPSLPVMAQTPYDPPTATRPAPNVMITQDGTQTGTFKVPVGKITVTLPDDIRAGDTISGTVSVVPNGQTPEEQAENRRKLADYVLVLPFKPIPVDPLVVPRVLPVGKISGIVFDPVGPKDQKFSGFYIQDPEPDGATASSEGVFVMTQSTPIPGNAVAVATPSPKPTPKVVVNPNGIPPVPSNLDLRLYQLPNQNSPFQPGTCGRSGGLVAINESCSPISQLVFNAPLPNIVT